MKHLKRFKGSRLKNLYYEIPLEIKPSKLMKSFLNELDSFDLDIGDYAIFGSGPIAIRGLIKPHDLDIIIKKNKYIWYESPIKIGNIEFSYNWPGFENINELIDTAEIIDGHPYVRLEYVEKYKNYMHREKDKQHMSNLASKMLINYINKKRSQEE